MVLSAGAGPVASCWPSTVASDQPPEARAMITAISSPPSSWPRRELRVAARPATTTRDSTTTSTSSSSMAGTATSVAATPERAAASGRTAKAARVASGANPRKEAASRPAARRPRGDRQQREPLGPQAEPGAADHDRPHDPADQPAEHQRGEQVDRPARVLEPDQANQDRAGRRGPARGSGAPAPSPTPAAAWPASDRRRPTSAPAVSLRVAPAGAPLRAPATKGPRW